MTKILIVGANSFLAGKLAEKLSTKNLVGLIHKNDFRVKYNLYAKIYRDFSLLVKEENEFDTIYLLAAYRPLGFLNNPDIEYVLSNIKLVSDISLAYPSSRIIFSSSVAIYGDPAGEIIKIDSPFSNPDLYGLTKLAGEATIKNHLSYAIIRFSTIWGKGIKEDTFIPRLIEQAQREKLITIFGNGSRKQNYIHYEDAVEMSLQVAALNENIVLLGVGKESYTNKEIAETVAYHTGATLQFVQEDLHPEMVFDANESFEKLSYWPQKNIIRDFIELL